MDALERLREEAAIQTVERPVVAIYGGSFDPPHFGHAMVIAWLLWSGTASEVWLVPTFQHAFDKPLAPFELRAGLCAARRDDWSSGAGCARRGVATAA